MKIFVKWPTRERIYAIAEQFQQKCKLQGVVGAIDGSHIRISAPLISPDSYYNRKKFHSIALQGVCDNRLLFLDVYAGWPGSSHDARVFKNSNLYNSGGKAIPAGMYLLGDAAYPLQPWLMTPYKDYGNLHRERQVYNKQHSKARQVIERAFGHLKGRFRRLTMFAASDIVMLVHCVVAACILHNVCVLHDDEVTECYEEPPMDVHDTIDEDRQSGKTIRDGLVQYLNE